MRQQKILIVDDDESIAELTAAYARRVGYDVTIAYSSSAALELLEQNRFDGFLLDVDMPVTSGIQLCRRIRQMREYEAVPIIFMTGNISHLEDAFEAGCDDLIEKPIIDSVLRARLNGHMQRAENAILLSSTRRMLDSYVSKRTREMAERAAHTGVLPAPTRGEVVVLFTDIRGFTSLSEEMDPDELFSLVSQQLAMQVHLVYDFGGYVDKFGGDGLMAVFDSKDMATNSCLCALQMIKNTQEMPATESRIQRVGIGIHMGPVVIGNLGSPVHLDYSAIGNTVNLAARLCGQAKPLSIVVSKVIRESVANDSRFLFDEGQSISIRGLKEPITIHTLQSSM